MVLNSDLKKLKSKTIKKLAPYSWWLQAASVPIGSNEAIKILLDIDEACLYLEKDNYKELENKIKPFLSLGKISYFTNNYSNYKSIKDLTPLEQEKRRQTWDFINELRACKWLLDNKFLDIKLIPKCKNKTPDIFALKLNKEWFIEVKTLHNPREEEDRLLQKTVSIKDVDRNYCQGLKSKIEYFLLDANLKFFDVNAVNKLLIIFTTYSISAYLQNRDISLNNYLATLDNENISIIEIKD